ncbi:MAG: phosphatidate cytidylyltransferase [Phaeospirillum sp.]|nr:phosphatidate cytidylyltransferase [Phaeospirillum sp.]
MLKTRAISAIVMAPPALLAAWAGGYAFAALVAVAAALMCWEWSRITLGGFDLAGRVSAAGCFIGVLVTVVHPPLAVAIVIAGTVISVIVVGPIEPRRLWAGLGGVYVGLPCVALVWLRDDPSLGSAVVWWLLLVVWATDIGAYAFGRLIGGPLLLPVVSPKKTWAGLLGGMICAALAGLAVARMFDLADSGAIALASAIGAVVAQAGDLFESWVKRRWGVKDSSGIIPGHGGVLDRVDGLLSAALTVAVLTLVSGRPVLIW